MNDSEINIHATADFVSGLGKVEGIELLPYHRLRILKYEQFGKQYRIMDTPVPDIDQMKKLEEIIDAFGLKLKH